MNFNHQGVDIFTLLGNCMCHHLKNKYLKNAQYLYFSWIFRFKCLHNLTSQGRTGGRKEKRKERRKGGRTKRSKEGGREERRKDEKE